MQKQFARIEVLPRTAPENNTALEPWFRERGESNRLRRVQTIVEQKKFALYFDRFGCLDCKSTKSFHAGNGLCNRCRVRFVNHLQQVMCDAERDFKERGHIDR